MNRMILFIVAGLFLSLAGCSSNNYELLPKLTTTPSAKVQGVALREVSPSSASAVITVELSNPNDEPMPLKVARYRLVMGGGVFRGDTVTSTTIPANGTVTVDLGASMQTRDADLAYSTSGTIEFQPPGELRKLLVDFRVPLPTIGFSGKGVAVDRADRLNREAINRPDLPWQE